MAALTQDLNYGRRTLMKNPGFTSTQQFRSRGQFDRELEGEMRCIFYRVSRRIKSVARCLGTRRTLSQSSKFARFRAAP